MFPTYHLHLFRGVVLTPIQYQQFISWLPQRISEEYLQDLSVIYIHPHIIVTSQCSLSEWCKYSFAFHEPIIKPCEKDRKSTLWSRMIRLFPKKYTTRLVSHDPLYSQMNNLLISIDNSLHWTTYAAEVIGSQQLSCYMPVLFDNQSDRSIVLYHTLVFEGYVSTAQPLQGDFKRFGNTYICYTHLYHFYLDEKIPLIAPKYTEQPNSFLAHIKVTHDDRGITETLEHLSPYLVF